MINRMTGMLREQAHSAGNSAWDTPESVDAHLCTCQAQGVFRSCTRWCPTSIAQRGTLATPLRTTHGLQGPRALLEFACATSPLSDEHGASVPASKSCTSTS